jgi:hypothetical protein
LANPVAVATPSIKAIKLTPDAIFLAVFDRIAALAAVSDDFGMGIPSWRP